MAPKKNISVIERRLQSESALQMESAPIPLKEKGWRVRWMNAEVSTDRVWNAANRLGWQYAAPEDLDCRLEEIGVAERDGRVVRGERGKEVLMKMRESDYKKIQQKKQQENLQRTFNPGELKKRVLGAANQELGDEAATFIDKHAMTVVDHRERVAIDGD